MGFELLILNPSEQEGMEYVDPRPGASLNPGWDNYPNASISKSSGRSLLWLSHAPSVNPMHAPAVRIAAAAEVATKA